MTTYENEYRCPGCGHEWNDHADSGCDDECPECGERAVTPVRSDPVPETE